MERSEKRILTTHVGRLVRPPELKALSRFGKDPAAKSPPSHQQQEILRQATVEVVKKQAAVGKNDARRIVLIARPVGHSATRDLTRRHTIAPEFLSGLRLERNHAIDGGQIHHALHYDGGQFVAAGDASTI